MLVVKYIIAKEKKPSFPKPTLSMALEWPLEIELEAINRTSKANEQWAAL